MDAGALIGRVLELPQEAVASLCEGAWPEPRCGVCRSLDQPWLLDRGWSRAAAAALDIVDFHDEPLRSEAHLPVFKRGRLVYERCLEIYAAARAVAVALHLDWS